MTNDYDGTLIAIEGLDGAGKTTITDHVAEVARDLGEDVVVSKEPTRSWTGDMVYEALGKDDIGALEDFYLFCADRSWHINNIIEPALDEGKVVITDRYADSTRAYQTHRIADVMDISYDSARRFMDHQFERWSIEPDMTLYLRVSVATALTRCDEEDKYERRDQLRQAEEAYDALYSGCNPQCRVIDAEQTEMLTKRQSAIAVRRLLEDEGREGGKGTYADAVEEDS